MGIVFAVAELKARTSFLKKRSKKLLLVLGPRL
jgi:hypothetical protein